MNFSRLINQKPYEKIIHRLHRHFITFVPALLLFLILTALPLGVFLLFGEHFLTWMEDPTIKPIIVLATSAYCLAILVFFYTYFTTFYLDMWIITNDRLVDIRQTNLFARTIAEVDLCQVQDVTSEVNGFFHTLFNYGDVFLQTAGAVPKFVLYDVRDPHGLRSEILNLAAEDKKFHTK